MRFLEGLDFKTQSYSKKQLEDEKFVRENPEAELAVHIFGKGKNIGTASIDFDTINTTEWQEKRDTAMKELREKLAVAGQEKANKEYDNITQFGKLKNILGG